MYCLKHLIFILVHYSHLKQKKFAHTKSLGHYDLPLLGAITFQHSSNVLISDCTTKKVFGADNELRDSHACGTY